MVPVPEESPQNFSSCRKSWFSEAENGKCPALILSARRGTCSERSDAVERERLKKLAGTQEGQENKETTTDYGSKRIFPAVPAVPAFLPSFSSVAVE